VLDLFSRQMVGLNIREHTQASVVTDALRMAWFRRRPAPGLIFHSDRGSQYCSHEFQNALKGYEMKSSMSRKGNCWDNAPTESLRGRVKVGRLYGRKFAARGHGRGDRLADVQQPQDIALDVGLCQSHAFEQGWTAAQQQDKMAV
jgi:putative transposase